ncbi:chromosome segregation SMC family protein [Terrihabitans sp. B22-R8]|uniref:chromosome segregation SMC family protein n=1 Tax=Terrihabitans sp. B22-R8 TaxID=3425128 RepID=UPI00403CE13F
MKLTRLRLVGFKSFVDASELVIEPGLTGIVGPNGCGKSNLVEALRWAMGESSHKALRAAEMNDVIFAGSGGRPSRNNAEVVIVLDNRAHRAPSPFTEVDDLEISRRIERDKGSTYRVNGREVRARDVQLLFADASTGARSPALVRQGQISEIINARPEARRRVLEEAAGIAGLHARRHEAELKLRAAEQNLVRVEDVLERIRGQIEGLKRQARQAARYRQLSADIRRLEGALLTRAHTEALAEKKAAEDAVSEAERAVAARTLSQAEAARAEAVAAHELPAQRDAAASAGAALARLRRARDDLDREERQARDRLAELIRRLAQLDDDHARETALAADANETLARFEADLAALDAEESGALEREADAERRMAAAAKTLTEAEAELTRINAVLAARDAERAQLGRAREEAESRLGRVGVELQRLAVEQRALEGSDHARRLAILSAELDRASSILSDAEAAAISAEAALPDLRAAEANARQRAHEQEAALRRLEVEAKTLAKLIDPGQAVLWPPLIDSVSAAPGYEAALVAALGEDLSIPLDQAAPAYWARLAAPADDPSLPAGVEPLGQYVDGPPELARRLAQTGLVTRDDGAALQPHLAAGQCLVSAQGDLWRWDGFTATAEAETPFARQLAGRNRLKELEQAIAQAGEKFSAVKADAEAARQASVDAARCEQAAREAVRAARKSVEAARDRRVEAERLAARDEARRAALAESQTRLANDEADAAQRLEAARNALTALADSHEVEQARDHARARVERERAIAADVRANHAALGRERERRVRSRETLLRDRSAWQARGEGAAERLAVMGARRAEAESERIVLAEMPNLVAEKRRALRESFQRAEADDRAARDGLAAAEARQGAADRDARDALKLLGEAREILAREEARREAAGARAREAWTRLVEAGLSDEDRRVQDGSPMDLERLKADRERLGAVNLRGEQELEEVQASHDGLVRERDDLTEAIRQLRQAILSLNREGKTRLTAAFEAVNAHFVKLYANLFGGGEARLELIESDDPLAAGLEVIARPPGKKPQTLSLLSGGEQALTAMALIFAIFLTNPAPLCVLDEVDAPLDDANVERFCDLLESMSRDTDTRFLVVTHNPVTMSRMSRLFGVTMAERGVSQLVSVDLEAAEQLREAV